MSFKRVPRCQGGDAASEDEEVDRRLRYGGPWIVAASELPLNRDLTHPPHLMKLLAACARRPRRLAALIALVLRTPTEYVVLSESSAGQILGEYFNQRSLGVLPPNRLCRGVLRLPDEHADYLRGRRRQALRTNLRRAASAGIRCEVVTDPHRAVEDASDLLRRRLGVSGAKLRSLTDPVRTGVARSEMTVVVARDQHSRPVAIAAVVIDEMVCLINGALATSHEARWALHDHLVQVLIGRRVRYLLAEGGGAFGALGFETKVQHYQHLLGYELRHVTPRATDLVRRSRDPPKVLWGWRR